MKLVPEMLSEFVQTTLSPEEIGDLLTMTGFELEEILEVEGEPVLDVNIMANRGDGASVLGLAREVNAKVGGGTERFQKVVSYDHRLLLAPSVGAIEIRSPLCTRYAALVIEGVRNGSSPDWMQRRLQLMGHRPISLLVDLTNYVMLELGQPLHAFDLDRMQSGGKIVVRTAEAGEKLTTLDDVEREFAGGELLICDGELPAAIAGVMGGASTEVSASTTRTLIESAHFDAQSVRATRKSQGLFTEASYRFERSVDPEGVVRALDRFAELYSEITGQSIEATIHDEYPGFAPHRHLAFRPEQVRRLMGFELSGEECAKVLESVGFRTDGDAEGGYAVTIPSWRPDVVREVDLVEEVGRIYGYEHIPSLLPQGTTRPGGLHGYELWRERLRNAVIAEGFTQVIGHSLVAGGPLMDPKASVIGPRVPASPEHQFLRSSLWPSLAMAARRNGGKDLALFEIGKVFSAREDAKVGSRWGEREMLSLLLSGELNPPGLKSQSGEVADFYALKGAIERVLVRAKAMYAFRNVGHLGDPRLHPTRQALMYNEESHLVARMGQIHPDIAKQEGLLPDTFLAEIDLRYAYDWQWESDPERNLSRQPSIRRDLAIVARKELEFSQIHHAIWKGAREELEKFWVFDVYEGPNIGEGMKSIGVAIVLRKPDRTFTDEEANQVRDRIAAALEPLGATLRVG